MGLQPTNTPEERATYKVKRRASAETEEYLKVDISVRGGTSYLPSEARRIHTPPLPVAGIDGRLRGFFFDYNAPRRHDSLVSRDTCGSDLHSASASSADTTGERVAPAPSGSNRPDKTRSRRSKPMLKGDWYDVELADLDSGADRGLEKARMRAHQEKAERVTTPRALSINRPMREEEHFDESIPEHLPSSPLCPRHPRYWRAVQNKGSQFRGCWMHGVGVLDESV
jgi:hypothetical protein